MTSKRVNFLEGNSAIIAEIPKDMIEENLTEAVKMTVESYVNKVYLSDNYGQGMSVVSVLEKELVHRLCDKIIEEKYQDIVRMIDLQVLANLTAMNLPRKVASNV